MSISAIKNTAYASAGGFAAGTVAAIGLLCTFTAKTAGPGLLFLPGSGLLFAGTAAVSRAVDEIFKKMGWIDHPDTRLVAAHIIVAIPLSAAVATTMGLPIGLGITIAFIISAASLGVNLLINDIIKN